MAWTVETLDGTVDAELAELPADMRAKFVRVAELIEAVGLPNVREPHITFVKKTQKTPAGEIELAIQRAKELGT